MSAALPSAAPGWLTPQPWRLQEAPPLAVVLNPAVQTPEAPLLLLIDRREPLPTGCGERLAASLSREERQRHQAYRLPADRQRFLLGRGGLRRLLGAWLELAPRAVPLESGPHGKPLCPLGPRFNLSHSGDLILLTLHPDRAVGVDVERLRPQLDWQALAQRLFSDRERLALERCPPAQRSEAFLTSWCRLEARLKARGTGLAGLEQLRQQEQQAHRAAPRAGDSDNSHPGREPAAGGHAPNAGRDADDQQPRGPSPGGERVWDVAVPAGYRAAVALAPVSD